MADPCRDRTAGLRVGAFRNRGSRSPTAPRFIVSKVFHVKLHVLVASAAQQIETINITRVFGEEHRVFTQTFVKKITVQLSVAEMIRVVKISAQRSHAIDNLPKLGIQPRFIKLIRRRHLQASILEPLEQGSGFSSFEREYVFEKPFFHVSR